LLSVTIRKPEVGVKMALERLKDEGGVKRKNTTSKEQYGMFKKEYLR
jgi:hypothetical protein